MRLHHVGIVITAEEDVGFWSTGFGLHEVARGRAAAYECQCIFLCGVEPSSPAAPPGVCLELILVGADGGPRRLKPGLHHIAFAVDNVAEAAGTLARQGLPPVEPQPVVGAMGLLVNFLSPTCTRGVRVELVQEPARWPTNSLPPTW